MHPLFPPAALKLSFLLRHALRQTASRGLKAEDGEWIKVAVKYIILEASWARPKRPIIVGKTERPKYRGNRDLLRQFSCGTGVSSTDRSSPLLDAPKSDAFSSNRERQGGRERLVPASFKRFVCFHLPKCIYLYCWLGWPVKTLNVSCLDASSRFGLALEAGR